MSLDPAAQEALDRVVALADRRAAETVALAAELIRRPSVNPDLGPNDAAEAPAQRWLRDVLAEGGGFDHLALWAEDSEGRRPNVVATRRGTGEGGRSLVWCGHTDVVPVSPEQAAAWTAGDPFGGEVRDGVLWGRGASDMKGAVAAAAMTLRLLGEAGVRLRGDVTLAACAGEESGQRALGCDAVLDRIGPTDLAIFPEPSNFAVYPAIKGEIYFRLTVEGQSTHIANRHLVAGPLPHGVARPGASAIDAMLRYQLATLELEREWQLHRTHPRLPPGGMFVSINSVHAGPPSEPVPTTAIPDRCEATGSLLFYPDLDPEAVIGEVRDAYARVTAGDAWLRAHPPMLEIPFGHPMKAPVNLPFDHPGVEAIDGALRALGEAPPTRAVAPFVCDANYWADRGQPCLVFGPGDPSWGIHGIDEHLPVADLLRAVRAFAAVTIAWCGVAGDA